MHFFREFKNFEDVNINLFHPFTLLIGPNGAGKSNVIEGIELLSFIANGRPLHEVSDIGRGVGGIEIRGGLENSAKYGHAAFTLAFEANIKFLGKNQGMYYTVTIGVKPLRIVHESLLVGKQEIFKTTPVDYNNTASSDIVVEYNNFARGGKKPHISVSANRSILSQYNSFIKSNTKADDCIKLVQAISNYLQASFIFDPDPKLMRSYNRIGENILARNGNNLSAVLYSLSIGSDKEKESLSRLLGWIKQLPDEPFKSFEFITTQLNDVIFCLKNENDYLIDARLLSDGTLRCLAVLTAVETGQDGSRVIIEEFDNGLHPSRVNVLSNAIQECCIRKKLNVLVTTHNPATLNALDNQQLGGVVLCVWGKNDKSSKLIKLSDLPRNDVLLESGRLGDLVTKRVIDNYLNISDEEYKNSALNWLKEF